MICATEFCANQWVSYLAYTCDFNVTSCAVIVGKSTFSDLYFIEIT